MMFEDLYGSHTTMTCTIEKRTGDTKEKRDYVKCVDTKCNIIGLDASDSDYKEDLPSCETISGMTLWMNETYNDIVGSDCK